MVRRSAIKLIGYAAGGVITLIGRAWTHRQLLVVGLCLGLLLLLGLALKNGLFSGGTTLYADPTTTPKGVAPTSPPDPAQNALTSIPDPTTSYEVFLSGLLPGSCISVPEQDWAMSLDPKVPSSYAVADCTTSDAVFVIDVIDDGTSDATDCVGDGFQLSISPVGSGKVCGRTVIHTGYCFAAELASDESTLSVEFNRRIPCGSSEGIAHIANAQTDSPACGVVAPESWSDPSPYFSAYLEEWALFVCVTTGPVPA